MGKYELLYIVHPDLEASIDKITDQIRASIEKRDGKITYEENWGKRKLAYEIKKSDVGIYILWYFEAPKSALSKIERDIRLTEEIIRFMLLSAPEKIKTKAEKPKKTEAIEIKEEKVVAAKAKKVSAKKKEAAPQESEEERMKKLDEKLGALIGEDETAE